MSEHDILPGPDLRIIQTEQFSFPYFDLILPRPGRCGFLTAPYASI